MVKELITNKWLDVLGDEEVIKHIVSGSPLCTELGTEMLLCQRLLNVAKSGVISFEDLINLLETNYATDDWGDSIINLEFKILVFNYFHT